MLKMKNCSKVSGKGSFHLYVTLPLKYKKNLVKSQPYDYYFKVILLRLCLHSQAYSPERHLYFLTLSARKCKQTKV